MNKYNQFKKRQKEILIELKKLGNDEEGDHIEADKLLLECIDNPKITEVFEEIDKWYA